MLAKKFFDDAYHNNSYFAKVGGVACEELNQMELKVTCCALSIFPLL